FIFLQQKEFESFLLGDVKEKSLLYEKLLKNNLIRGSLNFDQMIELYQKRHSFLARGPSLHIVVLTLRCDHKCVYCQAASRGESAKEYDMSISTAKRVVDTILESPSKTITIEFQGGEPLANWPTLKYIVEYARRKNKSIGKELHFTLVSNLTFMDEAKFNWIFKNQIGVCTSIDGPEYLHNENRKNKTNNSYQIATKWIKKIKQKYEKVKDDDRRKYIYAPGALITVTRNALKYPKEIVDEYCKMGFDTIYLRPLAKLGFAKETWQKIGYEVNEFIDFYKKALNYIFEKNYKKSGLFIEYTALTFLVKILAGRDPGQLDLRSPCGAGIGQILYNYDGNVFSCDEGRMLEEDLFKIGNVYNNSYKDIVSNKAVKSICAASCLDGTYCDSCVYKVYCGICPAWNYGESGKLFTQLHENRKHLLNEGVLDFLFEKMENKKVRAVFEKWVEEYKKQHTRIARVVRKNLKK
ncbi:MAG: His-Xaa-Ser system radical SAM maturase HxsB, partial [Candidatus Margulisbacteria bacterium]|nr:His-Xaa-Ser system radical SAM maturase HxsB [Candidatus Margulisiibacteriota bacterium]